MNAGIPPAMPTPELPNVVDIKQIAAALKITKRAAELRAAKESWSYTETTVRGGKRRLYASASLPTDVQTALLRAIQARTPRTPEPRKQASTKHAWQLFERAIQAHQDVAHVRLCALQAVEALAQQGTPLQDARAVVVDDMKREGVKNASVASLRKWAAKVNGVETHLRLAFLLPNYRSRGMEQTKIPVEAWDLFKADYLRLEKPAASACYERLQRIAKVHGQGWEPIPSLKTFTRRLEQEIPREVRILGREGEEAAIRASMPPQRRDRSKYHALEAVNADGHKFDVFVRWKDGTIARPILVGVQDIYSGKLLGYHVAETENSSLVRMAFRSVFEQYGIPNKVWLDNGRAFASKDITGGIPNRYRFQVKAEEPTGILTSMGMEIHWTTPYHGQAKPIERAWRDLCETVAKHPAFEGAYTGNKPTAKPENYGSKAIPLDKFIEVLNTEIAAHNARGKRRSLVCGGKLSFNEAFNASYQVTPIRKATTEQLRMLLLASNPVTAGKSGEVFLFDNRYWNPTMAALSGKRLILRFDPDALHDGVHVYTLQNEYITYAECTHLTGFGDVVAAQENARNVRRKKRANKELLEAERRIETARVAALLPTTMREELPPSNVVAPLFGKGRKPQAQSEADTLLRTGTDDYPPRQKADKLLSEMQAQWIERIGWTPPGTTS
jgi:transposase InsO family protein